MMYTIQNLSDDVVYWSNFQGWVLHDQCDYYTVEERDTLDLPINGVWVMAC
jgi:hypothetical protein